MNTSNNNIRDFLKAKLELVKNWLFRYSRIIMPVALVICVAVTIVIAVNANRDKEEQEAAMEQVAAEQVELTSPQIDVPDVPLETNAVPEVNELVNTYYTAMAAGDTETIGRLRYRLDDTEALRIQEQSKYIESYPTLEVYTKPGPKENTYMAYVYNECKFYDYDKPLPGLKVYYVCQNENGEYYFNEDEEWDESTRNYILRVNTQDDVIDLNNTVSVAYNDMVDGDEELQKFLVDLREEISKNVGEALAKAEGSETDTGEGQETDDGQQAGDGQGDAADEPAVVVTKVKATEVVNIRSSDSETADKLGKAAVGDEFTLLEARGNGWSKVEYEGQEAFIKSDYLEPSETQTADNSQSDTQDTENQDDTAQADGDADDDADDNASDEATGTVTVTANVRIRASASENSEKLGTAYIGEKLDLVMKQADGWTKIKYKGQTAYVKSDYVE